jgi:hypothetical protein
MERRQDFGYPVRCMDGECYGWVLDGLMDGYDNGNVIICTAWVSEMHDMSRQSNEHKNHV